jgi:hypothetical protein
MRKVISFAVVSMFVLGVANVAFSADVEKKENNSCLFHMTDSTKDVKYEVTNTSDGVTIKITSTKPELVKQIQESVSKCHEAQKSGDHKNMCPMKNQPDTSCHHKKQEEKKEQKELKK